VSTTYTVRVIKARGTLARARSPVAHPLPLRSHRGTAVLHVLDVPHVLLTAVHRFAA